MPKIVPCPVCKADVKAPRDAEPGDVLTCPDCDEEFTPPHLKKKAHDPEAEEAYGVGVRGQEDDEEESAERREKRRKARALQKMGREYGRSERTNTRPAFFGGPEFVLLIFAMVAGLAAVVGFTMAKRFPSIGEAAVIIIGYCGILGLVAWRKFVAR